MKNILMTLLLASFSPLASGTTPAVHVEMIARPNGLDSSWTLRGINGRKLLCPDTGTYANTCVVDQVLAPKDCDWECQDGILSGQGRSVFRGQFASEGSSGAPQRVFKIDAAWDTWRNAAIRGPLYRIQKTQNGYILEQVDRQKKARTFADLDFSRTDDMNFQLDPTRAEDMLKGSEGLLVTGQLQGPRFQIDQIWRQWSPRLTCDVWSIAKSRAFPTGTDALTMIFGTEAEATSYQAPEGLSVRWLIWEREEGNAVIFKSGINDLWSEIFSVAHRDCTVTVLAEH